jgi:lysophospholipase L1-like esterase
VLVLGDSLSAEYGLTRGKGWVQLLQQRMNDEKNPRKVVNASISGETTAGGRARLASLLRQQQWPSHRFWSWAATTHCAAWRCRARSRIWKS